MKKQIVITLQYGRFSEDIELPAELQLSVLQERLLETLKAADAGTFGLMKKIRLMHDGCCLSDETAVLADYGISDGDYLGIFQEE